MYGIDFNACCFVPLVGMYHTQMLQRVTYEYWLYEDSFYLDSVVHCLYEGIRGNCPAATGLPRNQRKQRSKFYNNTDW